MRAMHACAAAAVLLMVVSPPPLEAQGESCADGLGALMTDLGFKIPRRSMALGGPADVRFGPESEIRGVRPDGPAAGRLLDGDLLVALDGEAITTPEAARRFSGIRPGERVVLTVHRGGEIHEVGITAEERCGLHPPAPPHAPDAPAPPLPPAGELMPEGWLGFNLRCDDCGDDDSGTFRFRAAPVVASVDQGGPAAAAGIRPGDRLTHVEAVALTSPGGWPRFSDIQPGQTVRLTFARGTETLEVTVSALRAPARKAARG